MFVFPTTNDTRLVSSVSLNSGTTVHLYHNSVWGFYYCTLYICHSRVHSGSLMFNAMFLQLLNIFLNGFICRNNLKSNVFLWSAFRLFLTYFIFSNNGKESNYIVYNGLDKKRRTIFKSFVVSATWRGPSRTSWWDAIQALCAPLKESDLRIGLNI